MGSGEKRVALVTGASRGLGRYMALELARRGAAVAVNYFNSPESAERTVKGIEKDEGRAVAFQADITDDTDLARLCDEVEKKLGPVDILVNNATGPQPNHDVFGYAWEDYLRQLDFFLKAPFRFVQRLAPGMKERRWGRIVNIGSEVFDLGGANFSAYACAKGAMVAFNRATSQELGPYGITVNLVSPGWIPVERHEGTPQSVYDGYIEHVPAGRMGTPEEVASMVGFLCSEEASFVNGQAILVNGGRLPR